MRDDTIASGYFALEDGKTLVSMIKQFDCDLQFPTSNHITHKKHHSVSADGDKNACFIENTPHPLLRIIAEIDPFVGTARFPFQPIDRRGTIVVLERNFGFSRSGL